MTTVTRIEKWQSRAMFLALTVGLAVLFASSGVSWALPKDPIYNVCACACFDPATGFGEILADIQNTAGVPCGAYNNRACSLDGGTRTGTTKYCGAYKPGGTRAAMMLPRTGSSTGILSRGVEGENQSPAGEMQEGAVPMSRPGNVMMNCSCDKGNGSCSVTSKDGKTSVCEKGQKDTCTGTCTYPKGTISGAGEAPVSR
jgi:hypothetical protein